MATGDTTDVLGRLRAVLPKWFGGSSPILDALLTGLATASASIYSLYIYVKLQTRILTASDGWLDMVAADFFGTAIVRKANQTDASFRATIIANLFREKATRNAIVLVLTALTGRAPKVIEPQRPADTGAYSAPNSGYGSAGAYGSMLIPYQAFVQAYRPLTSGIPNIVGYGNAPAGYGVASQSGEYASMSMIVGFVQDADIYAAVSVVAPAASTIWTKINS